MVTAHHSAAPPAHRWRVALLEDQPDTRDFFEQGVRACPELELVGAFGSIAQARAWFAQHAADVFLTDIGLPDGNAISFIRELSRDQPACEILVVSMFGDDNTVIACIEAGALGYIHKDTHPANVAQTILDLKRGASPISPMIARKLLGRIRHAAPDTLGATVSPADITLTAREAEVLDLIARGYAYAEIARLSGLTVHTVQWHVKNLYSKLSVHSRSEAVFEASRMGLLKP